MSELNEIPEEIIINGVRHVLLEQRQNYYYRALVLPINGGDPTWLSNEDISRLEAVYPPSSAAAQPSERNEVKRLERTVMFRWIARQIDKWRGGNELTQWGCGRWYVRYKDGERSTTMYYTTACNYAEIFGGEVWHVADRET